MAYRPADFSQGTGSGAHNLRHTTSPHTLILFLPHVSCVLL